MTENTDDEHGLSMKEIQMRLAEYGCTTTRNGDVKKYKEVRTNYHNNSE